MRLAPLPYAASRSILVQAPPERIFVELVDFRRWRDWSPWEGVDPAMRRTYSGPKSGVGAGYAWDGNSKAGEGSMQITAVEPPRSVHIDLHFEKPFPADNRIRLDLEPQEPGSGYASKSGSGSAADSGSGPGSGSGASTLVTWSMEGEHTGVMRVLGRVMSMDRLVGKDFEKGLARLKALVER